MKVSQAVRVWNGTNINELRVHAINPTNNRAYCNKSLKPMFNQDGTLEDITCYACLKKINPLAIDPHKPVRIEKEQRCRVCGCTDDNCDTCVAKTGEPCRWIAADLCSACVVPA